jgi:formylglycine-generating enzyme required for sulfatase activity
VRRAKLAIGGVLVAALGIVVMLAARPAKDAPCGAGFVRMGPRCCPTPALAAALGACALSEPAATTGGACSAPLVSTDHGCDAPERDVVEVPATTVIVGPADWEAEGRVAPRTVKVDAFAIDRLEVSSGRACAFGGIAGAPSCDAKDPARAASGISLRQARDFCAARGGRLPTEDEWLAAAGGDRPRRYPWGDTGAVCRRAAWGLESGPCGEGGTGPDTVAAHPEGATPQGIHDLAGNVAEWVEVPCADPSGKACPHVVRGGSWKARLATELRTWLRREVANDSVQGGDPTVGFRCAYEVRAK